MGISGCEGAFIGGDRENNVSRTLFFARSKWEKGVACRAVLRVLDYRELM